MHGHQVKALWVIWGIAVYRSPPKAIPGTPNRRETLQGGGLALAAALRAPERLGGVWASERESERVESSEGMGTSFRFQTGFSFLVSLFDSGRINIKRCWTQVFGMVCFKVWLKWFLCFYACKRELGKLNKWDPGVIIGHI